MKPNTINAYICPLGHQFITRDVDSGTTPMTITCRHCQAAGTLVAAKSQFYNVDQMLEPTHEWYAPAYPQRIPDSLTRDHCQQGGLLLREVGEGDYTYNLPDVPKGMNRPMKFSELARKALTNTKR